MGSAILADPREKAEAMQTKVSIPIQPAGGKHGLDSGSIMPRAFDALGMGMCRRLVHRHVKVAAFASVLGCKAAPQMCIMSKAVKGERFSHDDEVRCGNLGLARYKLAKRAAGGCGTSHPMADGGGRGNSRMS